MTTNNVFDSGPESWAKEVMIKGVATVNTSEAARLDYTIMEPVRGDPRTHNRLDAAPLNVRGQSKLTFQQKAVMRQDNIRA